MMMSYLIQITYPMYLHQQLVSAFAQVQWERNNNGGVCNWDNMNHYILSILIFSVCARVQWKKKIIEGSSLKVLSNPYVYRPFF